ncbi:hypothetical protein GCM10010885_24380 [Alicyclobacillus cellulosilyticus]|uniref:Uncharacterized protein n=1 Tax=Alicyclobacillus cellulosilyticus TaxID=1003997 RepID=A0A917NNP1_9BACL|nr:hypothetical protein [Alicyclobacillus cellulosilyticus]GGJ14173.1 hypothetical protein GCM10010885_24380 [Alicyclobacillus cellulosilyticus]
MAQPYIAEYKVGKAVYWITEEGFVDNINPRIPGVAITYPWDEIYASLEFEQERDPVTGLVQPVLRWMRVYLKGGQMIAQMHIPDNLRPAMLRFYELFKETQARVTGKTRHR